MAGDWIKMRASLLTSPKVNQMARQLEQSPEVGRALAKGAPRPGCMSEIVTRGVMRYVTVTSLLIVWCNANEHTRDGVFRNADLADLDDMTGVPGFGQAMQAVGWADFDAAERTVTLPNFAEYNTSGERRSAGAKSAAQRQRECRQRKKEQQQAAAGIVTSHVTKRDVTNGVTSDVTSHRREEKRREEESPNGDSKDLGAASAPNAKAPKGVTPKDSPATKPEGVTDEAWAAWLAHRKRRRASTSQIVLDDMAVEAAKLGWTLEQAMRKQVAAGWQGFEADWVRREQQRGAGGAGGMSSDKARQREGIANAIFGNGRAA